MDALYMMRKIAETLDIGDVVNISVTSARGKTYIDEYAVEREKITYRGGYWERHGRRPCGGRGTGVRDAYFNYIVVPARHRAWEAKVYAPWLQHWPAAIKMKPNNAQRPSIITDEMTSWLDDRSYQYSILGAPYAPYPGYIGFKNDTEAFAFKMRFG